MFEVLLAEFLWNYDPNVVAKVCEQRILSSATSLSAEEAMKGFYFSVPFSSEEKSFYEKFNTSETVKRFLLNLLLIVFTSRK